MLKKYYRNLISADKKTMFFSSLFLILLFFIFKYLFLDAYHWQNLINLFVGHQLSPIGLNKINQLYFYPFNYFILFSGLFFLVFFLTQKFPKIFNILYNVLKKIWAWFNQLSPLHLIIIIFSFNLIGKILLLIFTPELSLAHDGAEYIDIARNLLAGQGFISRLIYDFTLTNTVPYALALFPPLFPILLYLSFSVFGANFLAAGLIGVICASLIPVLLYLFAWRLTNSKSIALISALLITFNQIIIGWSTQILTELPYTVFVILFFIFLIQDKKNSPLWAGVFLGLAFLTRWQAIIILAPTAFIYYLTKIKKQNFKKLTLNFLIICFIMLLITSPWLIRNYHIFGNPFHTSQSATSWAKNFQPGINSPQNFSLITLTKNTLYNFSELIRQTPTKLIGHIFLFILVLLGLVNSWRQNKRPYLFIYFYLLINYLFFSFFKPLPRYLYATTPIFIFFASFGVYTLKQKIQGKTIAENWFKISSLLLVIIMLYSSYLGIKNATALPLNDYQHPNSIISAQKAAEFFYDKNDIKTIMFASRHPNYLNYYLPGTNIVFFPQTNEEFVWALKQFNINYVVIPYYTNPNHEPTRYAPKIIGEYENKNLLIENQELDLKIYKVW